MPTSRTLLKRRQPSLPPPRSKHARISFCLSLARLSARHLGGIEEAMAAPSHRQKPRSSARHRWLLRSHWFGTVARKHCAPFPTIEPSSGGGRVQQMVAASHHGSRRSAEHHVLPRIQQDVAQRTMDLARRRQHSHMITTGEHPAAPPCKTVHRAREAGGDRHQSPTERRTIVGFDDQMRVVPLQRVVHQPESRPLTAVGEALLDLMHQIDRPQRRQVGKQSQRHVRRQRSTKVRPGEMTHRRAVPGFPARTLAPSTPGPPRGQLKSEL